MHRQPSDFAHVRVLLVEDEPLILIDCESILSAIGVTNIVSVTNAADATSALASQPAGFDVAILDISLSGSSSLPLAELLAQKSVPTGFMSGYSLADLPEAFRTRPYISKPFAPDQLRALLEKLLQQAPRADVTKTS